MNELKFNIKDVELVLNKYAERGNYLYKKLFLGSYPINNIQEAQQYIDEMKEYKFIATLFRSLCIHNWLEF